MKNIMILVTLGLGLSFSANLKAMEPAENNRAFLCMEDLEPSLKLKEYRHLLHGCCGLGKKECSVEACCDGSNSDNEEENCCCQHGCCDNLALALHLSASLLYPLILPASVLIGLTYNENRADLRDPAIGTWSSFGGGIFCPLGCLSFINTLKNLGAYVSNATMATYLALIAKALDKKVRISEELIEHFASLILDAKSELLTKLDPGQALALYYVDELRFRLLVEKHEFNANTYTCARKFLHVTDMGQTEKQQFLASPEYQGLLGECPILENHLSPKAKMRPTLIKKAESELLVDFSDADQISIRIQGQEYFSSKESLEKILSQVPSNFSIYSPEEAQLLLSLSRKPKRSIDNFSVRSKHLPLWLGILEKSYSPFLHGKCEDCYLLHGVPGEHIDQELAFAKKYNFVRVKAALIARLKQKFEDADLDEYDFKSWPFLEKEDLKNFFSFTWGKNNERYKRDPLYLKLCWNNAKKFNITFLMNSIEQFVPGNEKYITDAFLVTPPELKKQFTDIKVEVQ